MFPYFIIIRGFLCWFFTLPLFAFIVNFWIFLNEWKKNEKSNKTDSMKLWIVYLITIRVNYQILLNLLFSFNVFFSFRFFSGNRTKNFQIRIEIQIFDIVVAKKPFIIYSFVFVMRVMIFLTFSFFFKKYYF